MATNFAEQIKQIVKEMQAVIAKVKANSKAMMDAHKAMMDALVKTKPRQSEQAQGLVGTADVAVAEGRAPGR